MKKLFTLLTLLVFIGGGKSWGQKFSFNNNGVNSAPTGAEIGTAVVTSSDAKVSFAKEKGNGCMKFQSSKTESDEYFTLTPISTLESGDEITIGNYITNSSSEKNAQLSIEYYSNTDVKLATQTATSIAGNSGTNVLTSTGTPTDEVLTVPAAANGAKYIRIGRGSGNTNLFVSKFIITAGSPTLTGSWSKASDVVDKGASSPTLPTFSVSATKNAGDLNSSHYSVAYSLKAGSTDGILTINPSTGVTEISTATVGSATCVATVTSTNEVTYKTPATNTFEYTVTVNDLICATPTITKYGHAFQIACSTTGAKIYYTIDGSTPTTSSEEFTLNGNNLMALSASGTVKAIAAKEGYATSTVASEDITVPTVGSTTGDLLMTLQPDAVGNDATYESGYSKAGFTMVNDASSKGIQLTDKMEKFPYGFKAASGKITITPPTGVVIKSVKVFAIKNSNKSTGTITVGDGYSVTSSSNVVIPRYAYDTEGNGVMSEIVLTNSSLAAGDAFEFTLSSQFRFYVEVYGDVTATSTTINVTKEYTTYVPSYNLDFSSADALTAYIATGANASAVTLVQVDKVPAGTPIVLKATTLNSDITVNIAATTDNVSANKLLQGDGIKSIGGDGKYDYILSDGKFYHASAGTIAVGKAYLHLDSAPGGAGARSLDIDFGGTTGISQMEDVRSKKDDVYYDLQGRRVLYPSKGLYIVNGKKVILK